MSADVSQLHELQKNIEEYTKVAKKTNAWIAAKFSKEMAMNLYKATAEHHKEANFYEGLPKAKNYKIKRFVMGKPLKGGKDYKFGRERVEKIIKTRIAHRKAASAGWLKVARILGGGLQSAKLKTGVVLLSNQDSNISSGQIVVKLINTLMGSLVIQNKFNVLNQAIQATIANSNVYIEKKLREARTIFKH